MRGEKNNNIHLQAHTRTPIDRSRSASQEFYFTSVTFNLCLEQNKTNEQKPKLFDKPKLLATHTQREREGNLKLVYKSNLSH